MNDPKNWIAVLSTCAIGAAALLLIWKNDVTHSLICIAMLVPNAGQLLPKAEVKS